MPKTPGVPHLKAVRAPEKAGFRVAREGKHIVMTNVRRILTDDVAEAAGYDALPGRDQPTRRLVGRV